MKQAMLYVRSRVCLGCGKELTAEERKLRVEYCSQKCNAEWSEANPLPVVEGVTGQSEYEREFWAATERASAEVANWPAWKREAADATKKGQSR